MQESIIEIFKFIGISAPLFLIISMIALYGVKKIADSEKRTIKEYLKKELIEEKNTALALYMGATIFSVGVIISHTMALGLSGMVLFSIIGLGIQFGLVKLFEVMFGFKSFLSYISDVQNVQIATLYSFLVISSSYIIGSTML
ncbi:MAG: hypothetical protein Q9M94_04970 [Candidatus Gracilibacteria bacterium]|nr:hypothetical protein [Candidatus Gracilibacteria bacterium]